MAIKPPATIHNPDKRINLNDDYFNLLCKRGLTDTPIPTEMTTLRHFHRWRKPYRL
jgi:hypothetical protein